MNLPAAASTAAAACFAAAATPAAAVLAASIVASPLAATSPGDIRLPPGDTVSRARTASAWAAEPELPGLLVLVRDSEPGRARLPGAGKRTLFAGVVLPGVALAFRVEPAGMADALLPAAAVRLACCACKGLAGALQGGVPASLPTAD